MNVFSPPCKNVKFFFLLAGAGDCFGGDVGSTNMSQELIISLGTPDLLHCSKNLSHLALPSTCCHIDVWRTH